MLFLRPSSVVTLLGAASPLNRYTAGVVSNGFCVSTSFQPGRIGCSMMSILFLLPTCCRPRTRCDAHESPAQDQRALVDLRRDDGVASATTCVLSTVHVEVDAVAEQPLLPRRHVVDARVAGVAALVEHRDRALQQMLAGGVLEPHAVQRIAAQHRRVVDRHRSISTLSVMIGSIADFWRGSVTLRNRVLKELAELRGRCHRLDRRRSPEHHPATRLRRSRAVVTTSRELHRQRLSVRTIPDSALRRRRHGGASIDHTLCRASAIPPSYTCGRRPGEQLRHDRSAASRRAAGRDPS